LLGKGVPIPVPHSVQLTRTIAVTSSPLEIAPGARVQIRDEEWLVRTNDPCDVGGRQLTCIGVSELVRNREAIFLTALERVEVLDPAETELVPDTSSQFAASLLYLEARLRQSVPTTPAIAIGHRGAMDTLPFQLVPTQRAMEQLRPRFLIADAVGLGKTLEAGILVSELMRRGRGRRILVVTTKSMMQQFQQEFWTRFTIPLTRLDSAGIQRIRRQIPANHNPFHYYDKTIISIDTLKRDTEYRHYLESAHWDIIVIDEAHNVSFKGNRTLNYKLATLLAERSDALIMLTATPHSGDRESFASLMRMLDPTVLPRKSDYTRDDVAHLFARRFKRDVRDEIRQDFPDRKVFRFRATASAAEEQAFAVLGELKLHIDRDGGRGADMLFRTTLEKALLSSPAACLQTVRERIKRLRTRDSAHPDIAPLTELEQAVERIQPHEVSKLEDLVRRLQHDPEWRWDPTDPSDRLVIFTERIETLRFLERELPSRLGLRTDAVETLYGQLADTEMSRIVESFGRTASPLRLLIASDVASEGLNLHFQSHRLVHFDIPWSLMVFQQRNGRVDRYGQSKEPLIAYCSTESADARIRGDTRILDILIKKDEQAARNIGDPSIFFGLFDEEQETLKVAKAIESGQSAEEFEASLATGEDALDWLDALMDGPHTPAPPRAPTLPPRTLFPNDYEYVRQAFDHLFSVGQVHAVPERDPAMQSLRIRPDPDLEHFLKLQLGDEMRPQDRTYVLTSSADRVKEAISEARNTEHWPQLQYLWGLHPVVQWLDYKLLASIGRHRAPIIHVPRGVDPAEAVVVISALIPNRRGQPVIDEWFAVRMAGTQIRGTETLEEVLDATGLGRTPIPNAQHDVDSKSLRQLLPPALLQARKHIGERHREFSRVMRARADVELARLDALRVQHQQQLELEFAPGAGIPALADRRRSERQRELDDSFTRYQRWVRDTLEIEPHPHLTVAAVLIHA
jgi:superfamily II DNA or RNA helicase